MGDATRARKINVLLVEDDDVSAEAVMRSLEKYEVNCHLVWAEDGEDALQILRDQDAKRKLARPRLILLDLNMPRMNGFEFLDALRADPVLSSSVVFVLTTSDSDHDRSRAYHRHIAGYMVKSAVGPQFAQVCRLLNEYVSSVRME